MKHLNINVTTYVPKGKNKTVLELTDKLMPSLEVFNSSANVRPYKIILNVVLNNSTDENIIRELKSYMLNYVGKSMEINIFPTLKNSLTCARNFMVRENHKLPDSYCMFMDDDDKVMPNAAKSVDIIMNNIDRPEFQDRLNFYMFKWERHDGDFIMPRDIKTKPIEMIGKSTFTFSSWGWIANVNYLINNNILWPEFIKSPKLEDNYFHMRSHLVNSKSNFILTPIYVWNSRDNMSSMSNGKREFIDDLMEYLKTGNVGYDATPYVIRDKNLVELKSLGDFDYCEELGSIYLKGFSEPIQLGTDGVHEGWKFDHSEMCYKTILSNRRIRNLISVNDFMRNYSTCQLRFLAAQDPIMKELHSNATIPTERSINGKPDYDSIHKHDYIGELV